MEIATTNLSVFLVKKIHLSKTNNGLDIKITSVTVPISGEIVDVQTEIRCMEIGLKSLRSEKMEITCDRDVSSIFTFIRPEKDEEEGA